MNLSTSAAASAFGAQLRRFRDSRRLSVDELGVLLGISGNYIYMMERGRHEAAQAVQQRFEALSIAADIFAVSACAGPRERNFPIISWAQAGRATSYEELPIDWQDMIGSTCPDTQAFGIRLVGDSMEPQYHPGDIILAMPNCAPKHDCLVLAKLVVGDGVLFKRYTVAASKPHHFRLSSFNRKYKPQVFTWGDVQWVYPVYLADQRVGRTH